METGSGNGSDWRPELAAVPGAMSYGPEQLGFGPCVGARTCYSVRLPLPMVAAIGGSFCAGVKRRRRPKRDETMREPMERRQGRGNDRRPELATVSSAMSNSAGLRRGALGRFCAGSSARPSPSARLSVRFSVLLVAADGSSFHTRCARDAAGRRIHHRTRGACALPVGHRCVGQHAVSHLPLLGNPVFWAHAQRGVYVRG
jgi:hypothetical protein